MKHVHDLENIMAAARGVRVDVDLSKNIEQVARDAGMGYMQLDDGTVCHQQDYIRRLAHSKTDLPVKRDWLYDVWLCRFSLSAGLSFRLTAFIRCIRL